MLTDTIPDAQEASPKGGDISQGSSPQMHGYPGLLTYAQCPCLLRYILITQLDLLLTFPLDLLLTFPTGPPLDLPIQTSS